MKQSINVTPYLTVKGFIADLVEILNSKDKERAKQEATLYLRQHEIRVINHLSNDDPEPVFTIVKVFINDDYYVSFCHLCLNINIYSRQTNQEDCSTSTPYELGLFLRDFVCCISDGSEGETVILPQPSSQIINEKEIPYGQND